MLDLHCHSVCSDGTFTPEELAEAGRAFSVFALTDHDNCDGCARFLAAARGHGRARLAGLELSVEPGEGYGEFHLLGLGVDPASPALDRFLADIRAGRAARNRRIFARLAELGMPLAEEDVLRHARGAVMARPHFARALADKGYVKSVQEAFDGLLRRGGAAYFPRLRPSPEAAIAAVHAAGGAAVMAHPVHWTKDPAALRRGLARLKDLGLDGLEAVYQANTPADTVDHLRAAREFGLVVTAGSDFHGANKPAVTLGMSPENEEEFIAPLLRRIEEIGKCSACSGTGTGR